MWYNDKKIRESIKNMKPVDAFARYNDSEERLFISYYLELSDPITNIAEMCQDHCYEIPLQEEEFFTSGELNHLAKLFQKHLENYVQSFEGCEDVVDLKDLTTEQIHEFFYESYYEDHSGDIKKLEEAFEHLNSEEIYNLYEDDF